MLSFSTLWRFASSLEYFTPFLAARIHHFEVISQQAFLPHWLEKTGIKITDIAMPIPTGVDEKFPSIISEVESSRQQAIIALCQAASQAQKLRAPWLVIWAGPISFLNIKNIHQPPTPEQWKTRQEIATPYLERLCRSLFAVAKQFPEVGLCLLPARSWYEMPLINELELVQSDLANYKIHYWHQTAHVHNLEKQGLPGQEAWLTQYGHCTCGIHLEDVHDGQGLLPPGMGEIHWDIVKKSLPHKIVQVARLGNQFDFPYVEMCFQYLHEHNWD